MSWLDNFFRDLLFGFRLWKKRPGSFVLAVTALTLGIGLVTFSLSVLNCVFFGRLPFPGADRLVYTSIPQPDFRDFQEQQTTFDGLCAFSSGTENFKAVNAPSRRRVCAIGANFLELARATPLLGRGFLPGEDHPGAEPVALIGYDLWQQEFRGSTAAVGAVIRLDGRPWTIVGVMPEGFKFPINDNLWLPAEPGSAGMSGWGFVFGRLKPSVSVADARRELNLIAARRAASRGGAGQRVEARILVGAYARFDEMKGSFGPGPAVMAMLVVTLMVLFIACANVAGLTLANAAKRGTELAVRGALGATRARLISQMLIENLILAVSGALCGLLVIAELVRSIDGWLAAGAVEVSQIPFWMRIETDGRLLIGLIGLIFLTNLLAGLWPALQAARPDVNELLKAGAGGTFGARTGRFQWLLATVQIAFSAVVLTQSFVLLGFSQRLRQSHLPFDPAAVLTARMVLPPSVNAPSFFNQLERNLESLPGVQAAALSTSDPGLGHGWRQITVEGNAYPRPEDHPYVGVEIVSAGFFHALNVSFERGRGFNRDDAASSLPVAIVNSTFAKTVLPPGNPLGRRFRDGTNAWLTVVGCVPDLQYDPAAEHAEPVYYQPATQQPVNSMVVLLRGAGRAADWAKALRAEVARLQPDLAIDRAVTLRSLINHQIVGYHLASLLLAICGGASLFLASLGIFGLITLSVNQRTREVGVRLALGATRRRIVTTLLTRAIWQIAAGLSSGTILAFALNRILSHSIAGYPTVDYPALVFLGAGAFLGAVSLVAVLIPALRGARVDPMTALRYE
ncbi:MAG TPA: ADOP family duplicated permease [Dongiaceae bacterium]|nr:ADOP family duplicated permease [Dongiaceae bacterium]